MNDSHAFPSFATLLTSRDTPRSSDDWPLRLDDDGDNADTESGYAWLLLFAGLIPSAAAVYLVCSLPSMHSLSWLMLFVRSGACVALAGMLSVGGFWSLWCLFTIKPSFQPTMLFSGICTISMFLPAVALLLSEQSPWALAIVVGVSFTAASYLSELLPREEQLQVYSTSLFGRPNLNQPSRRGAMIISCCIEASILLLMFRHTLFASVLLSISSFVLGWRANVRRNTMQRVVKDIGVLRRHIVRGFLFAVFITALTLTPFLKSEPRVKGLPALLGLGNAIREHAMPRPVAAREDKSYVGIILWPPPQKKAEIRPPRARADSMGTWTRSQPLVIPFDGPYWYFKAPDREPGPKAHVVRGRPTEANIHSTDWHPLFMEAHQILGSAIERSCCREIQVAITNADRSPGQIWLRVSFVDSSVLNGKAESLGKRIIRSSEPQYFSMTRAPVEEVLAFSIPSASRLRRFDQITVLFLPANERSLGAAKVAIRYFRLVPR